MFIEKLLEEYRKEFGVLQMVITNFKFNPFLALYITLMVGSSFGLAYFFLQKNVELMIFCILIYSVIIFIARYHQKKLMIKEFGGKYGHRKETIYIFKKIINLKLNLHNTEEIKQLDELVKKEIIYIQETKKFPFSDIIRQLLVGLLITGLLAYSIQQLVRGRFDEAGQLVSLYIFLVGVIVMVGLLVQNFKGSGKIERLRKISLQLSELILLISINNEEKTATEFTLKRKRN
jgi:RsiW-degrading membrane proteinase PrsW (M82 family)